MAAIYFDATATRSYTALILRRFVEGPIALVMGVLILIPFVIEEFETHNIQPLLVAIGLLAFTVIILRAFIKDKLENDDQPALSQSNAACLLAVSVLRRMKKNPQNEYELLEAATLSRRGAFILEEMGLERDRLLKLVKPETEGNPILPCLEQAIPLLQTFKQEKIHAGIILSVFFKRGAVFEEILNTLDLSEQDLEMIIRWEEFHHTVWKKDSPWNASNIVRNMGGVGRNWVMGYNDALDRLTEDLSATVLYHKRQVMLHKKDLEQALHILSRSSKKNFIIMGKAGVGKRTFIQNIAYMLRKAELEQGRAYTRVLLLNAEELLSGTQDPDAFFLSAIKRADKTGRYILVIRNMGLFLQAGDHKLRGILGRVLEAKNIDVIGIADTTDYHTLIKTDAGLDALFEKIPLDDPETHETMAVLMESYFRIADRQNVRVTYKALRSIVELAGRYLQKSVFPGKAIALLADAVLSARASHQKFVHEDLIREIVSRESRINVEKVNSEEKDVLIHLEEELAKHVIGQRAALAAVSNALKRARLNIQERNRPIGTFLFLGPTGVGKTQTAKALAEEYFGREDAMIRLDMNEYSTEESVAGIVGSSDPRQISEGFLTKQVQDNPFSLLLLDEIEKAHPHVLNVFLQILDEGHFIDALGNKTDFRNTIIIATSNAGALFIRDFLQRNPDPDSVVFKKTLIDTVLEQKVYSPEFLNRFDDIVLYLPLNKDETKQVARLMIQGIVRDLSRKQGIELIVNDDALSYIAEKGYSPEFGAREMRRVVTDTLETFVADYLLKNTVKRGDTVTVKAADLHH